jgi:hypothetical protein
MSYGRNFFFLSTPEGAHRRGRYWLDDTATPIGAPVKLSATGDDGLGRLGVELATGDQAKPTPGAGGVLVYEYIQYIGVDENLVTYSDLDLAPAGAAVQVVNGTETKVGYNNTTATTFLTRTGYPDARIMVAGVGATTTVEVGEFLTPGVGNDTDGYWAVTTTPANAWLTVTHVNGDTGLVEAVINF